MADCVGQKLGNYRLTRLLGEGGFAAVYLGEHIYLKTLAAIKVLHVRLTSEAIESFLSEAQTIARLEHPHIIRVLEFGMENRTPYLVMQYAPYGTMRRYCPRGRRLPLATILPYVRQLASALQYAHETKLIHRDIKPENMLLANKNHLLLSDFGLAVIARSTRQQPTDRAGTTAYMAPEQMYGRPDRASDQYALAVVVYEWLTGSLPFTGLDHEVAIQHLQMPPPPLRDKVPDISPETEQVIMTALSKKPHQRFASILGFAMALEYSASAASSSFFAASPSLAADPFHADPSETSASEKPQKLLSSSKESNFETSHETQNRILPETPFTGFSHSTTDAPQLHDDSLHTSRLRLNDQPLNTSARLPLEGQPHHTSARFSTHDQPQPISNRQENVADIEHISQASTQTSLPAIQQPPAVEPAKAKTQPVQRQTRRKIVAGVAGLLLLAAGGDLAWHLFSPGNTPDPRDSNASVGTSFNKGTAPTSGNTHGTTPGTGKGSSSGTSTTSGQTGSTPGTHPTPAPTSAAQPTPTSPSTSQPTPTPTQDTNISLQIIAINPNPLQNRSAATAQIATNSPDIVVTLHVSYSSGDAPTSATSTTDSNGMALLSWTVFVHGNPHNTYTATIYATATRGGKTFSSPAQTISVNR